ncbi:MAG: carboxymuconolactone decarboxylase family protein [Bdellovibrionales bacterium]
MAFQRYSPPESAVKESQEYCKSKQNFGMRLVQELSTLAPPAAKAFADYYATVFSDGAIKGYMKELMFLSIGVSYCSPACLIHVIAAINGGATDDEIFEAVVVGTNGAGMVPKGPGIPYAFQYAKKVLEMAHKYRSGEKWDDYMTPPRFPLD